MVEDIIKEYKSKSVEEEARAKSLEKEASELSANQKYSEAANKWGESAHHFFLANVDLRTVALVAEDYKPPKLSREELEEIRKKRIELSISSAENWLHCVESLKEIEAPELLLADRYGRAGWMYATVQQLMTEEEIKSETPRVPLKFYSFEETIPGKACRAYSEASNLFYKIAELKEQESKFKDASFFYGQMGDTYLSAAAIRIRIPRGALFKRDSGVADGLYNAAECYRKAFELSVKTGLPSVVSWIRMIPWKHLISDAAKILGIAENISSDEERAKQCYNRAITLYGPNSEMINKCKEGIASIESKGLISYRQESYELLYQFERTLRSYVCGKLKEKVSDPRTAIGDLLIKWEKRYENETGLEVPSQIELLIDYADFDDYRKIIIENWSIFEEDFKDDPKNENRVDVYLRDLNKVLRRPVAHVRIVDIPSLSQAIGTIDWFKKRIGFA